LVRRSDQLVAQDHLEQNGEILLKIAGHVGTARLSRDQ
jgi:hypothetical protein